MPQYPHSPAKSGSSVCACLFASPFSFLPLPFLFLPVSPFPLTPFSCPMLTCHEPCAVQGRRRFSVPVSTLSYEGTQGLVSLTISQRNDFQEITVSCWRVFHHGLPPEPLAGGRHLRQFCFAQRLSPRMQACRQGHVPHCTSFPSGTWVENTSLRRCHAISTFSLVLILEHSPRFESKASRNQGNQRKSFTFTPF